MSCAVPVASGATWLAIPTGPSHRHPHPSVMLICAQTRGCPLLRVRMCVCVFVCLCACVCLCLVASADGVRVCGAIARLSREVAHVHECRYAGIQAQGPRHVQ
eukprot:15453235-Alexandrium_andersonii.AAC.1